MWRDAADYVRSLALDAYLVGGAVRDELLGKPAPDQDFLVPGLDQPRLRAALAPHGRVEDLEVAGQLVGVRFFPHDPSARALAPAGIELAPPRVERSTGPGRRDFVIEVDPDASVEQDLARRDFTVNAMARRLGTGELVDPFAGAADLDSGVLRTVGSRSFEEDPLRLVRGLRFVSQLGLEPDEATLEQMREHASAVRLVSAERIGGGLETDGMGELSKLLLGDRPARALRLARDTGVLVALLPEFEPAIGYALSTPRQPLPIDEHVLEVVGNAAAAGTSLAVRLAALLHDLGKPLEADDGRPHSVIGAEITSRILRRLRYPGRLRTHVTRIVRHHSFGLDGRIDGLAARRFLAEHGEQLARDLLAHKDADLRAKNVRQGEHEALAALRARLESERESPHRLSDLAIDGSDLIELGFESGPELGRTLQLLLDEVVERPASNRRDWLLARAARERSGERA